MHIFTRICVFWGIFLDNRRSRKPSALYQYHGRMLLVAACITLAGLLGGLINRLREVREGVAVADPEKFKRLDRFAVASYPYVMGLAAAWCVPLFLSIASSQLLKNSITEHADRFVILGLGIVASIASSRFLESLTDKLLAVEKKVTDARRKAEDAQESAEEASAIAESGTQQAANPTAEAFDPATISTGISDDERALLRLFARYRAWAPSLRGLMRELDWDESRLRIALDALVSRNLLHQLETTPTRKWVRWSITPNGRSVMDNASLKT